MENTPSASHFITRSSLHLAEGHRGHFQRETMSHCGGSIRILTHPIIRRRVVVAESFHCENSGSAPIALPGKPGTRRDVVAKALLRVTGKRGLGFGLPLRNRVT